MALKGLSVTKITWVKENKLRCSLEVKRDFQTFGFLLLFQVNAVILGNFFKKFGCVLESKIVLDKNFQSKRFGFVTMAEKEDVKTILSRRVELFIKGRRINVGPAIKKEVSFSDI